jgi:hypothetical protein
VRGPQPGVQQKLALISGVGNVRELDGASNGYVRYQIEAEKSVDLAESVFRAAVDNGWTLTELRSGGATLEEVFAELTR